jgi:hypothetical protein
MKNQSLFQLFYLYRYTDIFNAVDLCTKIRLHQRINTDI